jgi:hypothetical protein
MANSAVTPEPNEKPERIPRGSAPPALKLSEAAELARKIYDNAGGLASSDMLSQLVGNTITSSAFVRKLSALRSYGIVEDVGGNTGLTEIGNRIAAPRDVEDDLAAMKESLQRIETLNKIFERFKGRILPEEQFLKNIFIQELKIPREIADHWISWFIDAGKVSHLLHIRPDGKTQVLEGAARIQKNGDDTSSQISKKEEIAPAAAQAQTIAASIRGLDPDADLILIQLGRGRLAKLQLPEDWDNTKDLKRLLKMLSLSLSDEIPEDEQ